LRSSVFVSSCGRSFGLEAALLNPSVRQLHRLICLPNVLVQLNGTIVDADSAFAEHMSREGESLEGRSLVELTSLSRDALLDQVFLFSYSPNWIQARVQLLSADGTEVDPLPRAAADAGWGRRGRDGVHLPRRTHAIPVPPSQPAGRAGGLAAGKLRHPIPPAQSADVSIPA
jgi:PAS domain-containing protein